MRPAVLSIACVIVLILSSVSLAGPFDGKWKVRLVPDEDAVKAKEKEADETLTFTPTTFTTATFSKTHSFKPGPYEEDTRRFGPATFTCNLKNEAGDTAKWTGTVTATSIRGDLVFTKKDGTVLKYSYNGEKLPE